jgi:predicted RNase H-related nuclease YkuK (DUF458 family)
MIEYIGKPIDWDEVSNFINNSSEETKVYIGCDSERFRMKGVWFADYMVVIVVHKDGNKGAKVFGEVQRERDYDQVKDKPRMRLMTEVRHAAETFIRLHPLINYRDIIVHLDINPNEKHGSSCVIKEAAGYIYGLCQTTPIFKPDAYCASFAADHLKLIRTA